MVEKDILNKKELFNKLLGQGRLSEAIVWLKDLSERKMFWEITDRISKVEESYRYMLKYAMDGVADPHRDNIYQSIKDDLMSLFDRLTRMIDMQSKSTLYYTTLRMGKVRQPAQAVARYRSTLRANDAFSMASGKADSASPLEVEAAESDLFESAWITFPYSADDRAALSELMADAAVPAHVKILLVSAVMLGAFEFFDSSRAIILADIYSDTSGDEQLRMTALTALTLLLYVNRNRKLPSSVAARIEALRDIDSWLTDIKTVYLELIRTRDTERITSKLRDEIVPEMMKMKPEIDKRIKNDAAEGFDPSDMEENPEWQEFLESSGIADKMKELSEIQEEGGDVLMATFSQLKSFPFFHNISNWFLPFHADHSIVSQLGDDTSVLGELIAQSFFMCESDKYSFVLAFASMPSGQRNMLTSQLKAQNINAAEIQNASLNLASDTRRNIVNKYVQSLYRFFRLFRRHDDFNNPFASEINLTEVKPLQADFMEDSTLQIVGEFYFKHHYYNEAFKVFKLLESHIFPDATLYQKMGFCQQQTGNIESAVTYYEQAELLTGNNVWTTRRLASAHKQLGNYKKALEYYQRLDAMQPDKFSTAMNIGQCLLALKRYDEASKAFYKAEYLDETSDRPHRLLAWALLMQKDFDGAQRIYDRILSTAVQPVDYLNRGHLALARHDYHAAISFYRQYVTAAPQGWTTFIMDMADDRDALLSIGVDEKMLPLVVDAVRYDG